MEKKFIEILGDEIYYIRENTGKQPVLFIHGFSSSSLFMQAIISEKRDYDIIAIDLPGNGKSKSEKKLTIELYNEIVKEFITKLDLNNLIILGHSLGGATVAALSNLDVVKKGILVAPFNPFLTQLAMREKTLKLLDPKNIDEASESVKALVQNRSKTLYFKNIAKTSIAFFGLVRKTRNSLKYILYNQIINPEYLLGTLYEYYSRAPHKIIGISGNDDFFVPKETLQILSNEFNIPFTYLDNCGHATIYEKPKEVNDFINKNLL
ncbi:MAG: alpha/beta hydrolase [Mycoplasmatales bacterium]|nr:alpha/beta hydrolase [Mycoplasmatales bacterium]